jgi:septal ring factor EnvC (AmiA/AmiB activator)
MKKSKCLKRIVELTSQVFEENDEKARMEMEESEKNIKEINNRFKEIEKEIETIPDKIKDKNLELLESIVFTVYFKIRANQRRIKELEKLIEETKRNLEKYIDEKGRITEDDADIYTYFHDLIGKEELEKLDREYFGD